MEISNGINQPVNFYSRNTGNNIKMTVQDENLLQANIFAPEFGARDAIKKTTSPIKKKRKNKRLNTMDTDYLPDESEEISQIVETDNFFIKKEKNNIFNNIKKGIDFIFRTIPLVNYSFLKQKKLKIQKTVKSLTDINQNVDELMNTSVPYGESDNLYNDIAKNLTNAAIIIGKANKEI